MLEQRRRRPRPRPLSSLLPLLLLQSGSGCSRASPLPARPPAISAFLPSTLLPRRQRHGWGRFAAGSLEGDGWTDAQQPKPDPIPPATKAAAVLSQGESSGGSSSGAATADSAAGGVGPAPSPLDLLNGNGADTAGALWDEDAPLGPYLLAMIDEICLEIVESLLGLGLGRNDPGASPTEWLVRKALQRDGRELGNRGRMLVAKRCLGVTSLRGRLEFLVDRALAKAGAEGWEGGSAGITPRCRARLMLALYILQYETALGREGDVKRGLLSGDAALWRVVMLAARGLKDEEVAWPTEPTAALAAQGSLPAWLAAEWVRQYGAGPAMQLALEANRPGPVTLRWNPLLCPDADALLQRLAEEGVTDAQPCRWSPLGIRLTKGRPPHGLWGLAAWRDGLFEVQDEGSQLVALACRAKPGDTVLDLCAGNGGKSLAIGAAMLRGRGRLFAFDIDQARLRHLEAGAKRVGLASVVRVLRSEDELELLLRPLDGDSPYTAPSYRRAADPEGDGGVYFHSSLKTDDDIDIDTAPPRPEGEDSEAEPDLCSGGGGSGIPFEDDPPPAEGSCDVVLVDAPCSSTGVLRRRPSLRWTLDPHEAVAGLPAQQRELLAVAQAHVKRGGVLVYATCSLLSQENEAVAAWFLREFGDRFRALDWGEGEEPLRRAAAASAAFLSSSSSSDGTTPPPAAVGPGCLLLLPPAHGTDGFFLARFERYR